MEELKHVTQKEPEKATHTLSARIDRMITSIEKELVAYDVQIGSKLNLVQPDKQGRLTIEELESVLKVIKDHPNDARIQMIVKRLDKDGDGLVALHEIMELAAQAEAKDGHGVVMDEKKSENL